MRTRNKLGKFKKQYTKAETILYLKGAAKLLNRSPVYRDLRSIPGPSSTTIIRQFGSWSKALKTAGIRPHTRQLFKDEITFVKNTWKKMDDKEISQKLGVPMHIIRYYRLNHRLWKNSRNSDARSVQKRKAIKLYGKSCEICDLHIVELHHIISRKNDPKIWTILCPLCHAVLTRNLVRVKNRKELKTKLLPFIKKLHESIKFKE